jgi:hypothetical protein
VNDVDEAALRRLPPAGFIVRRSTSVRTNPASGNLSDRLVVRVGQAASARTTLRLYRPLLRLLSRGEPITIAELAAAAGRASDVVSRRGGWLE